MEKTCSSHTYSKVNKSMNECHIYMFMCVTFMYMFVRGFELLNDVS